MPTFKVTDPTTGQVLRLTGDSPPTEQELEQIFDPQGVYFADKKMMPSVVAHVAAILREHFIHIGVMEAPQLSEETQVVIEEKLDKVEGKLQCGKCYQMAVIVSEGCKVCTNCGESECG